MPITYGLSDTEKATIDPGDVRGPWTFTLPDTVTNNTACSIKAIADDQTPITVDAQGTATIEDPRTPGTFVASITFPFRGVGAVRFTYNAGLDSWVIYETASLLGALQVNGIWDVAEAYVKNDLVRHEGGQWVCNVTNTGVEPSVGLLAAGQEWIPLIYHGSGSVSQEITDQVIGTLGAGWTPIEFDTENLAAVGCAFDLPNDQFTFDYAGVWQLSTSLFFEHDNSQQGRTCQIRIFDVTEGTAGPGVTVGIGRNVTDSQSSLTMLFRIDAADTGDIFRFEIGNESSPINNVVITAFTIGLVQASV